MNTKAHSEAAHKPGHAVQTETAYGIVILSKDEIKNGQDAIKTDLNSIDARIHANAVQCMIHAEKHGDTSLMRRLLIETVGTGSGYRRQGLIAWMRTYSPMELKGDNVNLSGMDENGVKRAFKIKEANEKPFQGDTRFREVVPFFQQGLTSKMDAGIREFRKALANTQGGKPIDPSKPFYDGVNTDDVVNLVDQIEKIRAQMPTDSTRDIRKSQRELIDALGGDEKKAEAIAKAVGG